MRDVGLDIFKPAKRVEHKHRFLYSNRKTSDLYIALVCEKCPKWYLIARWKWNALLSGASFDATKADLGL